MITLQSTLWDINSSSQYSVFHSVDYRCFLSVKSATQEVGERSVAQTTRSQILLTTLELRSTLFATGETSNYGLPPVTRLPLPVLLTAQSCRARVVLSVPLNWNGMWAVQQGRVSQGWTPSLGDRRSRRCYLFKFRLFLCLFSGLSVGWKVFPLSHCSVLLCQPRTTQGLKTSGTQCCCLLPRRQASLKTCLLFL